LFETVIDLKQHGECDRYIIRFKTYNKMPWKRVRDWNCRYTHENIFVLLV